MRRTKLAGAIGLLGAAFVAAGCASWRAYGYDHRHFSRQPYEYTLNASTAATLHVDWDFAVSGTSFTASPVVHGNMVYIGALNGRFYAIHARGPNKGTIRWQYPPLVAPSPPDACGTTTAPLVITSGWGNPSGPGIASTAAVVKNVAGRAAIVVFGAPDPNANGGDGRVWALDAATGECVWKSPVIAPTSGTSKIGYSSPAIAHGRVYIGVSAKRPDAPITIGRLFAIDLATGAIDASFNFASMGSVAGGGVWTSPAVTPSGNVVITTGNSCRNLVSPTCAAPMAVPTPDYSNSMLKLDWRNGNVLWQIQPVHVDWDFDPDWAVSPIVGRVSCGSLAIAVQKDGYVHAADIKTGGPFSNPACSYAGHSLECPRWTFPSVPDLPFQEDGHGDTDFKRQGALDGDHLFIPTGGLNLTEISPTNMRGDAPAGRMVYNRLYSLNVCTSPFDRVRWIRDLSRNAGSPSVAKGLIYVGTWTPFDRSSTPHDFYVIADTDVLPADAAVCSYPNVLDPVACFEGGFRNVPVPKIVRQLSLVGSMQGIPAIVRGRVYVATAAGHLYALAP